MPVDVYSLSMTNCSVYFSFMRTEREPSFLSGTIRDSMIYLTNRAACTNFVSFVIECTSFLFGGGSWGLCRWDNMLRAGFSYSSLLSSSVVFGGEVCTTAFSGRGCEVSGLVVVNTSLTAFSGDPSWRYASTNSTFDSSSGWLVMAGRLMISGSNLSIASGGLSVSSSLILTGCTISAVDTLFVLSPTSRSVAITGNVLTTSLNDSETKLVINNSPYASCFANRSQ